MFNIFRKELTWGGRTLTLETGRMARQADGAVLATLGETSVLCTVVAAKEAKPDQDFFPLSVHYQEKQFSVGKIPGGFFKREAKPTEKEVLTSRLIDRPIRPLFPKHFKNEVQVITTVLSHDRENDPDMVAMIGASAALTISGIPFMGPIAAARVGYKDGEFILNPKMGEQGDSELDLVVAGTSEGVLMVESEASQLPEDVMLNAVMFGHREFQPVIEAIIELAENCAKDPWDLPELPEYYEEAKKRIDELCRAGLVEAYQITNKQERVAKVKAAKAPAIVELIDEKEYHAVTIQGLIKELEQDIVRGEALKGKRIDGRDTKTVRNIETETEILHRTHGSALFTRGETQVVAVATLGTGQDEQVIDALAGEYKEHFMLHYNFPPFSVGECGRMMGPGRREIGHGKLAWRAVRPVLPAKEDFQYTLRVVSEVTESNGSSSMATVCGTSMSLMDAGVPLKAPVAGIAMGLIKEENDFAVLTDILGDEDALGDMDFKVAGSEAGITALQMDIKITSITEEIMKQALAQAKDARLHILGKMAETISSHRTTMNAHAPRLTMIRIPKDKIREVIGSGGAMIREIVEQSGAKIDISDDGTVKIAATNADSLNIALEKIKGICTDPEVGETYEGKIVKVAEFGVIVAFLGGRSGLVHVSELAGEFERGKLDDVFKVGQELKVKVMGFDRGRIKLSTKAIEGDAAPATDPAPADAPAEAAPANTDADKADEKAEA